MSSVLSLNMLVIFASIASGITVLMGVVFNKKPQFFEAVVMFGVFFFVTWLMLPIGIWFLLLIILVCAAAITCCNADDNSYKPMLIPLGAFVLLIVVGYIRFVSG